MNWIKCSDRMPEERVITLNNKNEMNIGTYSETISGNKKGFYDLYGNLIKAVKKWRPLPNPPEED